LSVDQQPTAPAITSIPAPSRSPCAIGRPPSARTGPRPASIRAGRGERPGRP
jgi:hypothetical protein